MGDLNERIKNLDEQISSLESKLQILVDGIQEKIPNLISKVGTNDKSQITPVDIKTGFGNIKGGSLIWNSSELNFPPINAEPIDPTTVSGSKGYNKHSHSRFSGGALIKDVLEIVEYVWGSIVNKHSQQYWQTDPTIATEVNSNGETVEKIGKLDLIFNADTLKWGVGAFEIDVKKCYLVERDDDGNIVVDSKGQQKKSSLYNSDATKTVIVWDENAACFRFYAVYAPNE